MIFAVIAVILVMSQHLVLFEQVHSAYYQNHKKVLIENILRFFLVPINRFLY